MAERHGLERLGFLTVTPPDHVTDRAEWQRRWNSLATHVLRPRYRDWMRVVERMKSGRIHAHCLVALEVDIRTGFDFAAVRVGDYGSASPELRAEWRYLRTTLPRYGFGRHELLPIRDTSSAIAGYVGKYIGKHLQGRKESDKGWRLVAYGSPARVARTRFSWATEGGAAWRAGCRALAGMVEASRGLRPGSLTSEGLGYVLGPRWSYEWRDTIRALGAAEVAVCDPDDKHLPTPTPLPNHLPAPAPDTGTSSGPS